MPGVVWWVVSAESPIQILKKNRIVIFGIATSKNHILVLVELLAPVRSETGFVILGKFRSRFDLRQRRN
jgi:hypothetical protein